MKKRNPYYKEIEILRRMLLIFKGMTKNQVAILLGKSEEEALFIMKCFGMLKKGYFDEATGRIAISKTSIDFSSKALSVYLDFRSNGIAGNVFGCRKAFTVCAFFDIRDEILYEIVHIPFGEEQLANQLLKDEKIEDGMFAEKRRVVILDQIKRKELVLLSDVFSYCAVNENGEVVYYG